MRCVGLNGAAGCVYDTDFEDVVKFIHFPLECAMASKPAEVEQPVRFGEGYELDVRPRLRRGRL
jgi:hypothetical protein